jgi:hypothetical protein
MAALVMTVAAGCGKTDRPGTVRAGGRATYKGQPLAGATVTFVPQSGKGAAVGMTDESGRFRLISSGSEGALPGAYKVTVTKTQEAAAGAAPQTTDLQAMQKADMVGMKAAPPPAAAQPSNLVPSKYATADKTPLTFEVTQGGKNEFDLDLVD